MTIVGRVDELNVLHSVAQESAGGALRLVVVEGEPGIGKTNLLRHAQTAVELLGHTVIWIRHDPVTAQLPFGGFAEVFGDVFGDVANTDGAMESLLDRNPLQPSSPALQRGIVAYVEAIEKHLANGPTTLFVEDLHFADSSTLIALGAVPRRLLGASLLVVATTRPGTHSEQSELLRTTFERAGSVAIRLGPLEEGDIIEVAREFLGHAPNLALAASLGAASGNPFLATQLALASTEPLKTAADSDGSEEGDVNRDQLPGKVRTAILRRLVPLSKELLHLIELASVFGDVFAVADLAAVADERATRVGPLMRDLIDRSFLEERGQQLAFRHHLVRSAVYENIPASVRAALHLDVARHLAAQNRPPMTVAHHFVHSYDLAGGEAVPWLRRAARIQSANDPDRAFALLEQAVALASPTEQLELEADRTIAYVMANRMSDALEVAARGLERITPSTHTANIRSELRLGSAAVLLSLGRSVEATQSLRGVIEETRDPSVRAFACGMAGLTSMLSGDAVNAEALANEAMEIATGDYGQATTTIALNVRARVAGNRLDFATSRRLAEAAIGVAVLDQTARSHGVMPYLFACMAARDDEDMRAYETWARLGYGEDRPGLAWSGPAYYGMRADMLRLSGNLSDALAEAETGMQVANETQSPLGSALCAATVIDISTRQGNLERAIQVHSEAQRWLGPAVASFGFDAFTTASMRLSKAKDPSFDNTNDLWSIWSFAVDNDTAILGRTLLLPMAIELQSSGQNERMAQLAIQLGDWPSRSAFERSSLIRAASLVSTGIGLQDLQIALDGIAVARNGPNRLQLADGLVGVSELAVRVGEGTRAADLFREAQSLYDELGCTLDATHLRVLGGRLGLRTRRGRPGKRAVTGWESLSPTETTVAKLVSEHLTNREIADALFVSHRTVETHLRNIFSRLSLDSRRELARRFAAEQR